MTETNEFEIINKNNCVMVHAMDIIGGKWRLPIIWKLYQNKTMRYNELKRSLVGITNIMLTRSLRSLEESGLVSRVEFNQIPPKVEYSLTDNCQELVPALEVIYSWGRERMIRENLDL
ncbi:winged helix-turn-helix transcriptional regulator [Peptoclostridium acidaminophilum]|uniref:winged helix-turn-helix transcriptional regulator n=1 Tax=Peptoclostridium acidaminophilum TaxID=1731 RepID=UPI00046D339D|nr:helix-turn-helix domain-containing protein [Peptoclostridium acidaminophilum]